MCLELAIAALERSGGRLDEGEPGLVQNFLGQLLPGALIQYRLRVKQIQVRRGAGHENENARLGLGFEVWLARGHGVGKLRAQQAVLQHHGRQRHAAHAAGGGCEKVPARLGGDLAGLMVGFVGFHGYSRVINSSRLSITRAVTAQALASASPLNSFAAASFCR